MVQLLYQDSGSRLPVSWWNAVNAMGKDGMLQHGTIVDVEPDGVVVDFGCASQRRQSVKYGDAFGYWQQYHSVDDFQPEQTVEVLLRQDSQSPWVWRTATLITAHIPDAPSNKSLALVSVLLRGAACRQLVGYTQVRPTQSDAELRSRAMHKNDFWAASVSPLPADISGLLPSHSPLWKLFCHELLLWGVSCISVSSSELLVLHRTHSSILRSRSELEELIQQARQSMDANISTGVYWVEDGYRCCPPLACGSVEGGKSADSTGKILQDVHHLVLAEMFTYVDTIERTSLRRVCRAFDELISGTLSAEIRVTYRECSFGRRVASCSCTQLCEYYPMQATLLKCVTARTRRILIKGGHGILSDVLRALGICGSLGQCVAGQQVSVAAVHCDLSVQDTYSWGNTIEGFWEQAEVLAESVCGGYCKQLMLKQCSMSASLPGVLFSGNVDVNSVKKDLCRLGESQLPGFDAQRTAEWVMETVHGQLPDYRIIMRSLNEFTTPDPRANNAYVGYKWTEDNLASVDVAKLSRLALYALSRHVPLPNFLMSAGA